MKRKSAVCVCIRKCNEFHARKSVFIGSSGSIDQEEPGQKKTSTSLSLVHHKNPLWPIFSHLLVPTRPSMYLAVECFSPVVALGRLRVFFFFFIYSIQSVSVFSPLFFVFFFPITPKTVDPRQRIECFIRNCLGYLPKDSRTERTDGGR